MFCRNLLEKCHNEFRQIICTSNCWIMVPCIKYICLLQNINIFIFCKYRKIILICFYVQALYIYIYTHTHTHTHTYIYIYIERERERYIFIYHLAVLSPSHSALLFLAQYRVSHLGCQSWAPPIQSLLHRCVPPHPAFSLSPPQYLPLVWLCVL